MTKKMLAVALMASSLVVLTGCNKTPAEPVVEPDVVIDTPVVDEGTPVIEIDAEDVTVDDATLTGEEFDGEVIVVEQPVEVVGEVEATE